MVEEKQSKKQNVAALLAAGIILGFLICWILFYRQPVSTCQNVTIMLPNSNNNIQAPHYNIRNSYIIEKSAYILYNISDFGPLYGYSMQPAIFDKNTVLDVKYDNKNDLHEGQIVRYIDLTTEEVKIHRIKGLYPSYLMVQGDNSNQPEKIYYNQITHIVVGVLFS